MAALGNYTQVPAQYNTHWLLEVLLGLTGKTGKCLTQDKFDCKSPKFRIRKRCPWVSLSSSGLAAECPEAWSSAKAARAAGA